MSLDSLSLLRRPTSDDSDEYLGLPVVYDRMRAMRLRATRLRAITSGFSLALTAEFPGRKCDDDVHSLVITMMRITANMERVLARPESRAHGDVEALKREVERNEADYNYAVQMHKIITNARRNPPRTMFLHVRDVPVKLCLVIIVMAMGIVLYNVLVF